MLNQITIMGRLTKNPELRTTNGGTSVCSFTVAVDRDYGDKQTDFIECVAWKNTGEFISRYFSKGHMIALTGKLQSRKWQDRDGNNRIAWEVNADHAWFCGSRERVDVQVPANTYDGFKDMPGRGNDNPFPGANGAYKQAGILDDDGELPF